MRKHKMRSLWSIVLCLVFLGNAIECAKDMRHDMTLDAQQALFDEFGPDGLDKIKGVTALYREGLKQDYKAYYEVTYDAEYVIVSSGRDTADRELISRGENPPPTSQVRDAARRRGATCVKFYVMTTSANVMCSDELGRYVATDIPDHILLAAIRADSNDKTTVLDVSVINRYIKSKSDEQAKIWRKHTKKILAKEGRDGKEQSGQAEADSSSRKASREEEEEDVQEKKRAESFLARAITPGFPVQVVTGHVSTLVEVRVRSLSPDPDGKRDVQIQDHLELCQVVIGCVSTNEKREVLSREHIEQNENFIDLELDPETEERYNKREFVFALDIVRNDGSITTRHFGVKYPSEKHKRSTEYTPWSSWTYWVIGSESEFPNYDQFQYGSPECEVGCGPVAWSMVFGYYDRRSHLSSAYSGSESLYNDGADGMTGSSAETAPKVNDVRMENYIAGINTMLGTNCGGTIATNMDRISTFYKDHQLGSPWVYQKRHPIYSPRGIYSAYVSDWVRDRLKEKWPVVIGWDAGSYIKWHYPVATKLRKRSREYRICDPVCGSWQTEEDYDMFLHMGWGVYSNGAPVGNKWTQLDAYYAIIATYYI